MSVEIIIGPDGASEGKFGRGTATPTPSVDQRGVDVSGRDAAVLPNTATDPAGRSGVTVTEESLRQWKLEQATKAHQAGQQRQAPVNKDDPAAAGIAQETIDKFSKDGIFDWQAYGKSLAKGDGGDDGADDGDAGEGTDDSDDSDDLAADDWDNFEDDLLTAQDADDWEHTMGGLEKALGGEAKALSTLGWVVQSMNEDGAIGDPSLQRHVVQAVGGLEQFAQLKNAAFLWLGRGIASEVKRAGLPPSSYGRVVKAVEANSGTRHQVYLSGLRGQWGPLRNVISKLGG